ncbi:hypothetical protein ACCO45_007479 [Purpureocillium lilacinum]|uniref:Uncharacterized protein n=1 Tax=Purpureocillium lilacinum TaxID=33203 RepID=A0ACC4DSH7_PURLI
MPVALRTRDSAANAVDDRTVDFCSPRGPFPAARFRLQSRGRGTRLGHGLPAPATVDVHSGCINVMEATRFVVRPVAQTATKNRLGPICREVPEPSLQAGAPHSPEPMPLELPPAAMPSIVTPPLPAESAGGCNMTSGAPNFMPRRNPFSSSLARLSMPPSVRSWTAVTFSSLSPAKPTRTHRRQIGDVGDARMVSSFSTWRLVFAPSTPEVNRVRVQQPWGGRGTLHSSDIAKCGASGQTDVTRRDKLIASPQPASSHADALFRCEWGRIPRQSPHLILFAQVPRLKMVIGNIYVIAAVAVTGGGLFGFDISSLSAQLGEQAYKCYFNQGPHGPPFDTEPCSGPRELVQGGITASMSAGSWLGALISGPLSDRLGRKYSIMVGCIIWLIGSTIICASQNIGMLIAGRIINGLCVGIESAQVPVYIAEISPPSKRGRFIGMQQWAITWGILIMYYISYGTSFIGEQTPPAGRRRRGASPGASR